MMPPNAAVAPHTQNTEILVAVTPIPARRPASALPPTQVPHPGLQFRGLIADDDPIIRAIPPGQLAMEDLPGARLTADDDDGRLGPGSFTAHGRSQLLRRSGGNAG
jgi:hypothetical protein